MAGASFIKYRVYDASFSAPPSTGRALCASRRSFGITDDFGPFNRFSSILWSRPPSRQVGYVENPSATRPCRTEFLPIAVLARFVIRGSATFRQQAVA